MDEMGDLQSLAQALGVHTSYTDGLGRHVTVAPETLLRVCAALGAPVVRPADAAGALRAYSEAARGDFLQPVLVARDGALSPVGVSGDGPVDAELRLEDGTVAALDISDRVIRPVGPIPLGYHRLTVETSGKIETSTVIASPVEAWRRSGSHRNWGIGAQLAALRSARSRCLGDLRDLESVCRWVNRRGGDLVMVLPLVPTFNREPPEPSPYSPVSRLFWSELILDLGASHRPVPQAGRLDVAAADAEVRAALAGVRAPDPSRLDDELLRYARFRGAQTRLGRNWRNWPRPAREGRLEADHVDSEEERFHLVAQTRARRQLEDLRRRLDDAEIRVGLDLAVGVHPDGYDSWSRQTLFGDGMSVGAPPDSGFPSGQDWGFPPVLPGSSRREGHRYVAACIAHQMEVAGVLRVDHIMAWTRLYWIPHGFGLNEGTYVSYPAEELFAVLALESNRHLCEVMGENLGTVPPEIDDALPRHRVWGMYLAQFQASKDSEVAPPASTDVALVGTHDTPTFAGWLQGVDIHERLHYGLLAEESLTAVREERRRAAQRLAKRLGCGVDDPKVLLGALLEWLGRSDSPLVIAWLEDLWLEPSGVNLPGTRSMARPNWQRPMRKLLDEIFRDADIDRLIRRLDRARHPD